MTFEFSAKHILINTVPQACNVPVADVQQLAAYFDEDTLNNLFATMTMVATRTMCQRYFYAEGKEPTKAGRKYLAYQLSQNQDRIMQAVAMMEYESMKYLHTLAEDQSETAANAMKSGAAQIKVSESSIPQLVELCLGTFDSESILENLYEDIQNGDMPVDKDKLDTEMRKQKKRDNWIPAIKLYGADREIRRCFKMAITCQIAAFFLGLAASAALLVWLIFCCIKGVFHANWVFLLASLAVTMMYVYGTTKSISFTNLKNINTVRHELHTICVTELLMDLGGIGLMLRSILGILHIFA